MNGAPPDEQIRRAGRVGDPALILWHLLPCDLRAALLHRDNDRALFGHGCDDAGGLSAQTRMGDHHALGLGQGRQRAFALAEFPALLHGRALGPAPRTHRVADESVAAGIHRHAAHGLRPVGTIAVRRACATHGDGRATLHTLATDYSLDIYSLDTPRTSLLHHPLRAEQYVPGVTSLLLVGAQSGQRHEHHTYPPCSISHLERAPEINQPTRPGVDARAGQPKRTHSAIRRP